MSLLFPILQQSVLQHNLPATPSPTAPGTAVTASGTPNVKGSWVELISSANFDVCGISLAIFADSASAAVNANLYDIGVGAAGSEQPIVSNLLNTGSTNLTAGGLSYFLPLEIKKGTRISARHQSNVASKGARITTFLHGGFSAPPWKTFAGAEGIGVDTADSGGTTHTPGNSGAESAWANIGTTLAKHYGAMLPIVSTGSDTTMTSLAGHLEVGINSTTLAEYLFGTNNTEFISYLLPSVPFYGNFPIGTQMQIRAEMSGTADTDLEFALLGFF